MAKREIKCPHCNNWTVWTETLYDQCKTCDGLIEEEKINRLNELAAQKKIDDEIKRIKSANQNPYLKKANGLAKAVSIGFMIILTAIIVLAAG